MIAKSNDYDLRAAVVRRLLTEGVLRENIRHELTLDTSSNDGRIDIAVLSDTALGCIELKSGKDKLDNALEQMRNYLRAFDTVRLVACTKHHPSMQYGEKFYNTDRYGVTFYCPENKSLVSECFMRGANGAQRWFEPIKDGFKFQLFNLGGYYQQVAPVPMARLLWKAELDEECGNLQIKGGTREGMLAQLREAGRVRDIRQAVLRQLRARTPSKWEQKFWNKFDAEQAVPA